MDTKHLRNLLDVCFTAKHVIETLPELPKGMKPRHIHVLERIDIVYEKHGECRVSDVRDELNITMPSITKLVQELEALHLIEKYSAREDKRVALLKLTDQGLACVKKYVYDFHNKWAGNLNFVSNEEAQKAVWIIEQLDRTMPK